MYKRQMAETFTPGKMIGLESSSPSLTFLAPFVSRTRNLLKERRSKLLQIFSAELTIKTTDTTEP